MHDKISPETERQLLAVVSKFWDEDNEYRLRQLREWRRMRLLWEGFTNIYWSETAHDWRIWDLQQNNESETDQSYYDKPVNVFRAYLESIIAALSVTVPPVVAYPDDADNPDVEAAKSETIDDLEKELGIAEAEREKVAAGI